MTLEAEFLSSVASERKAPEGIRPFSDQSWERLIKLGLPSRSHPAFRFVPLRELYSRRFTLQSAGVVTEGSAHLVFVDGHFSKALSALPSSLVLLSLQEALLSQGGFLHRAMKRSSQEENDPFALLNLSVAQEGAFLYVPPGVTLEMPLQLCSMITGATAQLVAPRLHLVLGKGSRLSCQIDVQAAHPDVMHLMVPSWDLWLEEGAELHLEHRGSVAFSMESLYATVRRGAKLSSVHCQKGALLSRQSYHIDLKEEGAEVELSGLSRLEGGEASHTHVHIAHLAPHTRSMQRFKGVLGGRSRSSFSGKIFVDPIAQKTEAYQLNQTLLLSPHAQVVSEPNLEIGADDVKASHGSTITALDEKQLFYFNARGIDRKEATEMLIEGFCQEILDKLR